MSKETKTIGKPVDRVDGRLKVTGQARYAAEARVENVAHGVLVLSTIAAGKVKEIDTMAAEKAPGVIAVLSHHNAAKLSFPEEARAGVDPAAGEAKSPARLRRAARLSWKTQGERHSVSVPVCLLHRPLPAGCQCGQRAAWPCVRSVRLFSFLSASRMTWSWRTPARFEP